MLATGQPGKAGINGRKGSGGDVGPIGERGLDGPPGGAGKPGLPGRKGKQCTTQVYIPSTHNNLQCDYRGMVLQLGGSLMGHPDQRDLKVIVEMEV